MNDNDLQKAWQFCVFQQTHSSLVKSGVVKSLLPRFKAVYPVPVDTDYPPAWLDNVTLRRQAQDTFIQTAQRVLGPQSPTIARPVNVNPASLPRSGVVNPSSSIRPVTPATTSATTATIDQPSSATIFTLAKRMADNNGTPLNPSNADTNAGSTTPAFPNFGEQHQQMLQAVMLALQATQIHQGQKVGSSAHSDNGDTIGSNNTKMRDAEIGYFQPDLPKSYGKDDPVSRFHRDMTPGVGARHRPPARAVDHVTSGVDIRGFGSCGFLCSSFSLPTV